MSVSATAAAFAQRTFGIDDSAVVPDMVDLDLMRPLWAAETKRRADEPRLAFVGNLVSRKGVADLVEAFAQLHRLHPSSSLCIAGDGPLRPAIETLVRRRDLHGAVSLLGTVSESEKAKLLGEADIACFPSRHGESFGVVLLEAMAAGTGLVVGGDNPGYRELMGAHPETLIDPRDTTAMAKRLSRLLTDDSHRARLHAWQQELVRNYDASLITDRVLAVYRQAIVDRCNGNAELQPAAVPVDA